MRDRKDERKWRVYRHLLLTLYSLHCGHDSIVVILSGILVLKRTAANFDGKLVDIRT